MRSALALVLCVSVLAVALQMDGGAQQSPGADARVGLKPGVQDAGQAALHLALIASIPRPEGFFDPSQPLGRPTAPEQPANASGGTAAAPAQNANPPSAATPNRPSFDPVAANRPSFSNTDVAFSGERFFVGNYHGFNAYDIEGGGDPRLLASVVCPGGQGDVSVYGRLLFMSVEELRARVDCGTQGVQTPVSADRFKGIRIFDISDLRAPKQVAAVQTCRGSHTHTVVTDPDDPASVYLYGSGTGTVRSAEELAECSGADPKDDPNTALFSIDVIQVPLAAPQEARIVNRPRIFADPATGAISGLWQGGNHGAGTQSSRVTSQCHDITVFPEIGLAAGACSGNGILLDISDPVRPVRLDQVVDQNFAYWHSATFNNDGSKVIFTDEWGGGRRPRCRATDRPTWGADAIFDIVDRKLRFGGYYKLPAPQTDLENCVAHNGSVIPVPGRDIMVQAWYQGGISVFDFTDSAAPFEIAYFDRGPLDAERLFLGGYWSAYWYHGGIYASEIVRGIDVFTLQPSEHLTQNEIDAATLVYSEQFNAQHQTRLVWPVSPIVAHAYLDQLTRTSGLPPARVTAVRTALEAVEGGGAERDAAALDRLDNLATALEDDAPAANARDAGRLRALAATLKAHTARLRG